MALSTQPYKGARDFYPEDKRLQKYLFGKMRTVVEKFGYEEYDAPVLELTELYAAKTSDEIVNEQTYTFTDRGGRSVTMRTEMTPSVSRMVAARRQELAYPLRWYSIPNLWRYERMQRGRLREFWQLNVDLFGVAGLEADFEIIQVADAIMKGFGAKRTQYTTRLSSRKFMNAVLSNYLGLTDVQSQTLIKLIDKKNKMEYARFVAEADVLFTPTQRDWGGSDRLLELLKVDSLDKLPQELQDYPSVMELRRLMKLLESAGITNAVFDMTLMRGFDYYTDIVFEVFDNDPANNRAMFGGGRYDGLVAAFGVEPVPTVGFGMGDVTLLNFLETYNLLPKPKQGADLYVVLAGDVFSEIQELLRDIRGMGIKVAVDTSGRKLAAQLKAASKKGVRYVMVIGEEELKAELYVLRDMQTGEEEKRSLERIVSTVKDFRK